MGEARPTPTTPQRIACRRHVTAGVPLPALSLPADGATGSAVANDVGVEHVFVRQLVALGESRDIALGISTSGRATNVVAGLSEAKRRGMLTVALTGYDGGSIARDGNTDFCFVARHEFVPPLFRR